MLFEDEEWEAVQSTRPIGEADMPIPFCSSSVEPTRPRSSTKSMSPPSAAHGVAPATEGRLRTTEPEVQFSHFQVCQGQNQKAAENRESMEPHDVRLCPHLENEWERDRILEEAMSLDDMSSAWVLPSYHAVGELVCLDCLAYELGRKTVRAWLELGSPSVVLCVACDSTEPCELIPGPDDDTPGWQCKECGCGFA